MSMMLSFPVRLWTWKQWDTHAFQWTHSFSLYKQLPTPRPRPRKASLSFPATLLCFSSLPLPQFFVTSTDFGPCLVSLSCLATCPALFSVVMTSSPCLSCQVEPTFCGPSFYGATLLSPWLSLQDTHQQLWEASHPGPFKRKAWKDFLEHQFRAPTTSQTIRGYWKSPIHFPLLLPLREN